MSLKEKILDVVRNPSQIKPRASLAVELEQHESDYSIDLWATAIELAARQGDFFNALAITRLHLPEDHMKTQLARLASIFALGGALPPLDEIETMPEEAEIPEDDVDALLAFAVKIGSSNAGMPPPHDLAPIPIFGALQPDKFAALAERVEPVSLGDGEVLVKQGEMEQALYLLSHGNVRVLQKRNDQEEIQFAEVPAPSLIGEMSLLMSTPRRASVIAQGPILAWRITSGILAELTEQYPELLQKIRKLIELRQLRNLIQASQLFQGIEDRDSLLQAFSLRFIEIDEEVFEQGAPPPGLFVILHGQAVVFTRADDGRRVRVADLAEGDTFGEMSLLTNQPTAASIWMPEGGVLLHLSPLAYHHLIKQLPELQKELSKLMTDRKQELKDLFIPIDTGVTGLEQPWYGTELEF